MSDGSPLFSGNAEFLDALYQQFRSDPDSVDPTWRNFFDNLSATQGGNGGDGALARGGHLGGLGPSPGVGAAEAQSRSELAEKQVKVLEFISANRYRGHREADLDPLRLHERPEVPELHLQHYGFTEADLERTFNTASVFMKSEATLREIRELLKDTYCATIGTEITHITSTSEKRWIQKRLEKARGRFGFSVEKKRDILKWLTAARKLEEYLHRKYVGQKRFSLEGGEALIPILDDLVQRAGEKGVKEIVVGMAHRGRLNVLVNILGKHPKVLFGEFEGKIDVGSGSGDVKYHLGFSSDVQTPGGPVHLVLAFNPSHLEIINPVVEGSVRARQERRNDRERNEVLPILVHGDAAFAGQGVVTETLNLSETRGYATGGTVHVIVNNQIGFTTSDPRDARSTLYCTDVAKLVQAPIFHVNGNDAEAVVFVTQLALDFRMRYKKDVVIDLVCFRRYGHNESDEPLATQPMMYKRIKEQKGPRRMYAERLIAEGVIAEGEDEKLSEAYLAALEANQTMSRPLVQSTGIDYLADWTPYLETKWRDTVDTRISMESVETLGAKICALPEGFELHRSVQRIIDARLEMARGERPLDWGFAENLAYAALLTDGYSVRFSGQDSQRGTFFHRHAVLHNQVKTGTWTPLQHLFDGQPRFRIINSLLSEEAVLGFEYGYSTADPEALVIWEAQFGDFANGAQVVIDQFLSSSEAKWGRFCGLVLMLPHGYDGQGPEHSSARLERFLQLCAEENMQVCVPSTPAQLFHMFRRQMLRPYRKPLIVMSPKSLLRHRLSTSSREDLTEGGFQITIDEIDPVDPKQVERLVLCAGKVYFDILEKRRELELSHVAIARVEQLYPFPEEEIVALFERYPKANEICWAQEEPRNQGSWFHMLSRRHLAGCIQKRHKLVYAGRTYSASPAAGYLNVHLEEQRALVQTALGVDAVEATQRKSA
ncbi:MAG: 2-oxoglutarate dehydrogenase E1 component [Gammaproteobacteria bacterium]|nr:2-oxoglutarate dehydrogenase E1 component [Gammaproteobacteria bacterium]